MAVFALPEAAGDPTVERKEAMEQAFEQRRADCYLDEASARLRSDKEAAVKARGRGQATGEGHYLLLVKNRRTDILACGSTAHSCARSAKFFPRRYFGIWTRRQTQDLGSFEDALHLERDDTSGATVVGTHLPQVFEAEAPGAEAPNIQRTPT